MRAGLALTLSAGMLIVVSCGDQPPAAEADSGLMGVVHLGPQCPAENSQDRCDDQTAALVTVIVFDQLPGEAYVAGTEVARTTTAADGTFMVALAPGQYVVTAEAGMSCELMDARVARGTYVEVDVPCDTGIR